MSLYAVPVPSALELAETKLRPVGSVSVTATPEAEALPVLVTVRVWPPVELVLKVTPLSLLLMLSCGDLMTVLSLEHWSMVQVLLLM